MPPLSTSLTDTQSNHICNETTNGCSIETTIESNKERIERSRALVHRIEQQQKNHRQQG